MASQRKKRETSKSDGKVRVVTSTMLKTPMHTRKQIQGFAKMREHNHH